MGQARGRRLQQTTDAELGDLTLPRADPARNPVRKHTGRQADVQDFYHNYVSLVLGRIGLRRSSHVGLSLIFSAVG